MEPSTVANSRRSPSFSILAILLGLTPSLIKLLCYPHNIGSDDAYIHLQVARNVVSGHGWGLNVDTPVNLSSSPAFTLLVVLVSAATAHIIPIMQAISCVASTTGLLLIYRTVRDETGSEPLGLLSEASAALSCDLWRWNGTMMEASIAFLAVALLLFLLRKRQLSLGKSFGTGIVVGLAILLRPELLLAAVVSPLIAALYSKPRQRIASAAIVLAAAVTVVAPWAIFAQHQFHSILPTTFSAKSVSRLILWNPIIAKQMLELAGESFLWPVLLATALAVRLFVTSAKLSWRRYLLPAALLLSVMAFYYLKTPGLESPGRYMLPFLPCAAVLLGLLAYDATRGIDNRRLLAITATVIALQATTSFTINQFFLAPSLQRFESEYGDTMRSAANFIASRILSPKETVLAEVDVGLLAYAAHGRFQIYDGGGLASPELSHLALAQQLQISQPAYVIQSQGTEPAEWDRKDSSGLRSIWYRRYRQHGLSQRTPYLFANIYSTSLAPPLP
jgi:hypothetical protein